MLTDLISRLKQESWYCDQIAYVAKIPPTTTAPPVDGQTSIALHPVLQDYLAENGITLYRYQEEVIEAVRAGSDVTITTPTASGKTLAFNLPIFETLLEDPEGCALYLYPLKALANDQQEKLLSLEHAAGLKLFPNVYDGDTPANKRGRIKQVSRLILTNPHALHYYLPWHHQWSRFFSRLRYIVIDEAHRYRGLFGANVALLLRRLFRLLNHYGASPQIILSSASIANPVEHARALTGRDVVSISEESSVHGEKQILFWDALLDPSRSITMQAAELLAFLTAAGVQTLCFTGSRAMAEVVARAARDRGARNVLSYRAGYLPQERREIETALRERRIDGVVSTSALEAGIDIGSLDAVILVGLPGSLLSAWQQAGRAGRGNDPSLVVFMPYENPLDRYFLHHPEQFLGKEREQLVIQPENPDMAALHLMCAAAELPLRAEEVCPGGLSSEKIAAKEGDLLDKLAASGFLAKTPRGYIYRGRKRAHDLLKLDAIAGEGVRLICEGRLIETMDRLRARRNAYPGAVLLHRGETYLVERLDLEEGVAVLRQEEVSYHTKSMRTFTVNILATEETLAGQLASAVSATTVVGAPIVSRGRAQVTESFAGYKKIHSGRTLSIETLDLPEQIYETDALWITFPTAIAGVPAEKLFGGLHGAEHALIAMAPLLVLCDREDIGGASTPFHEATGAPTILIFDEIDGGAGIAEVLFSSLHRLAEEAWKLVSDCSCESGCPACIYSPRCGSRNHPLDKGGAIRALRLLASELAGESQKSR